MKKRNLYCTAAVIALGGVLLASTSFAQSGDATPTTSRGATDMSGDTTGVQAGTAIGSPSSSDTTATPEHSGAPAKHLTVAQAVEKVLDTISKHPTEREVKRANNPAPPAWKAEQDTAVEQARAGHYDVALPALAKLHADHPEDLGLATDYAAILGWAGRDADAVAAYKALSAGDRPDYLIDSIGHSYRNLHQPEEALAVYRLGLKTYPANQSFLAGEILSLLESGNNKEAVERATDAADKYTAPSDSLALAMKLAFRADAVALARAGNYKPALAAFVSLHAKYPSDNDISGDYVAVLSWAGHDKEAVALFRTLPQEGQPDYILDAAAHSYRNLRQPKQALDLYQAALDQSPDNVTYAVGVIYCLSELGRSREAFTVAEAQLAKHPEKPAALVKAYVYVERRQAIDLARAGHFDQALKLLRELRAKYPSDITEQMDYIAVSSWAGHDAEAVKEYKKIERKTMPDYVLEAVGGSYRALHEPEKALVVYRRGLKQSPGNEVLAAGEIRCLDDLKRYDEGQARATEYTKKYGDRLEVLLAGGEAANFNEQSLEALRFYEHAVDLAPENKEALRGLIHAEDLVGAAHLALRNADRHPGLMNGQEYSAIVGDTDQDLVRWGPLEPVSEATRYAETDRALASLDAHIADWTAKNDPDLYPNIQRARFDRLVALRDRQRMQDVVDEYNALVQSGVDVPTYALEPVGDAYLHLHEPEIARDIFLKVLQTDPNNFEARRLLAYAYLECDQYDESFATIDKLQNDEPVWIYLKGEPERQPNPDRAVADLDAGDIRNYSGLLQEADDHLTPIVQAGPSDARNRAAAGNVYLQRGLPRKAMEQYQIGLAIQDGHDAANEAGIASANLALQNFPEAEAGVNSLIQRFPEDLAIQRLDHEWQVHNMAEIDAHAGYNFAPSGGAPATEVSRGQGYDVGAELYSAPIDYNWRLFAGEDFAREHEPNAEGTTNFSRTNAGVEYRNGDVTGTLAPTINAYNNQERLGADGTFKYAFNDMWSAGIAAELFSAATPLRALNAGVTANQYDVNTTWRQNESRELTLDAYAMPFSDGNFRTVEDAQYIERLYTDPNFKLDGEGNLASSQDSKNENRLYYNPSLDATALAGLRGTQTLYHRYDTLYEHSLLGMAGLYSQQHYGTSPAWTVRYEHRYYYNETLNAGAGVNYTHQDYDGAAEDAVSLTVDVVERF